MLTVEILQYLELETGFGNRFLRDTGTHFSGRGDYQ